MAKIIKLPTKLNETYDKLTEEERNLLRDMDVLPLEELKAKYDLTYKGKQLSDVQIRAMLSIIKEMADEV
jgi:DNA-directed RNA polymerase sigma subunit (sigma70/sigma32)